MNSCSTCTFWLPGNHGEGACHRHAPITHGEQLSQGVGNNVPIWPTTRQGQWCGDWTPFYKAGVDAPIPPGRGERVGCPLETSSPQPHDPDPRQ